MLRAKKDYKYRAKNYRNYLHAGFNPKEGKPSNLGHKYTFGNFRKEVL